VIGGGEYWQDIILSEYPTAPYYLKDGYIECKSSDEHKTSYFFDDDDMKFLNMIGCNKNLALLNIKHTPGYDKEWYDEMVKNILCGVKIQVVNE
jgi:hypothetical protein